MIFVTGASRSGTTMLSRVLGNADSVCTLNELHFFGELVPVDQFAIPLPRERANKIVAMTLARVARDYWVEEPTDQEWMTARRIVQGLRDVDVTGDTLFAQTMAEVVRDLPADRVCEQTPRNIYYAQHLLNAFPAAHVVHVVRDPRAVLASQKDRYKIRRLGGSNVPVSEVARLWLNYHPVSMLKLWRSATNTAQSLQDHERVTIVRYEDIIAAPDETIRALCATLGLEYSDDMLQVPHWGSSTVTHSESAGLSAASLDQWQTVLNAAEIRYCENRTRQERADFGYADCEATGSTLLGNLALILRFPLHAIGALLINPRRVVTVLQAMLGRGQ